MEPVINKVLLRFLKCEGQQLHFVRDTVVQPAVAVDDVLDHPSGGTTANDELHVVEKIKNFNFQPKLRKNVSFG